MALSEVSDPSAEETSDPVDAPSGTGSSVAPKQAMARREDAKTKEARAIMADLERRGFTPPLGEWAKIAVFITPPETFSGPPPE
jgi:hypothetical protein